MSLSDFRMLKNLRTKIGSSTGCKIAVRLSLSKKCGI